jgi:bla regulator protein blaR1
LYIFKPNVQANTGILEYLPYDIGYMQRPSVDLGVSSLNYVVDNLLPAATPMASVNPMQIYMLFLSGIWVIGIIALLSYGVVSYLKVFLNINTATLVRDNIYETDRITIYPSS